MPEKQFISVLVVTDSLVNGSITKQQAVSLVLEDITAAVPVVVEKCMTDMDLQEVQLLAVAEQHP